MTILEQHILFKSLVDKMDSYNSDLFDPEDIDVLLNFQQQELIKNIVIKGIEQTQTKTDMLSKLRVVQPLNNWLVVNPLNGQPGGNFIGVPNNYLKTINEECIVTTTDCHGNTVDERRKVIPSTDDYITTIMENPFTKPDSKYATRMTHSGSNSGFKQIHEIITHDSEPKWYILTYYREPVIMGLFSQYPPVGINPDVDCELSLEAQYWITEQASIQALLGIESQRYPAQKSESEKLDY